MSGKKDVNFDEYAASYEEHLNSSISLSGEKSDYFDRYKIDCIKRWVCFPEQSPTILDFGCGVGRLAKLMAEIFSNASVHGYDPSSKSIEIASEKWKSSENLVFKNELAESSLYDLITVANVFHHIKPKDRQEILSRLQRYLKKDGLIVLFDHNPYNPLTRHVVNNCPFDEDAELLNIHQLTNLALECDLEVNLKRYIVFFPNIFAFLRILEPFLGFFPLGAQYMVILGKSKSTENGLT